MKKTMRRIMSWFVVVVLLLFSGVPATASDNPAETGNRPGGPGGAGGPPSLTGSDWLDKIIAQLVEDGIITQYTADAINKYIQEQEEQQKATFEKTKNMSEEERRKYMEQSRQGRNSMWAELVNKGITTQSVVDKIMELMPKRDDSKKPQPPADNNGPAAIKVYINGAEKVFSPAPININGSVLVPMRSFFEALGCTVQWDDETKTAIGIKNGIEIKLPINKKNAYVNGHAKSLSTEARIINNSTFIPLRFVGEALGADVVWENGSIKITHNK